MYNSLYASKVSTLKYNKHERKIASKQQYLYLNLCEGYNLYKIFKKRCVIPRLFSSMTFLIWWNKCGSIFGAKTSLYMRLNTWIEDFFVCGRLADHHWRARILYVFLCVFFFSSSFLLVLWRPLYIGLS